jgi:hypothetical protein
LSVSNAVKIKSSPLQALFQVIIIMASKQPEANKCVTVTGKSLADTEQTFFFGERFHG